MVTVALAGATTGFGLTMLRTFIHLNSDATQPHKIIVLSRTAKPELTAQDVEVRSVDYGNHSQLVSTLSDVHTLLSTIGGSPEAMKDAQLALVAAAKEAGVKRFAPSEYAANSNGGIDLYAPKIEVWKAAKAAAKETGMEITWFQCGLFMSLLATGTPKPVTEVGKRESAKSGEEEALSGLRPWNFVLNMKAGTADLPCDGTAKMVWTDMRDIATFVYHALSLDRWPEIMGMVGDEKSFREVLDLVERVQGRRFLVKENSVEEMEQQAEADPGKVFYSQCRIEITKGWMKVHPTLNKLFPDFKPMDCEAFVEKWWGGVKLDVPSWGEDASFM